MQKKECEYCGEYIQVDAQKCRYCREWLTEESKPDHLAKQAESLAIDLEEKKENLTEEVKEIPLKKLKPLDKIVELAHLEKKTVEAKIIEEPKFEEKMLTVEVSVEEELAKAEEIISLEPEIKQETPVIEKNILEETVLAQKRM